MGALDRTNVANALYRTGESGCERPIFNRSFADLSRETVSSGSTAIAIGREPEFGLGEVTVRPALSEVSSPRATIRLQPRVMQVLVALAQENGGVVSRADLVSRCWGGTSVGEDALNRCIQRLRKLSDECPGSFHIKTIPRVGYRLERIALTEGHEQSSAGTAQTRRLEPADASPRLRAGVSRVRVLVPAAVLGLAAVSLTSWILVGRATQPVTPRVSISVAPLQVRVGDEPARIVQAGLPNDLARALIANPLQVSIAAPYPVGAGREGRLTLDGNAFTVGGTLQAQLRLRDSASEEILWSKSFTGQASEAGALRERAALKLGAVLNCAFHTSQSAVETNDATRLYLSACDDIGDSDPKAALEQLRRLTTLAPHFAEAWAELAATVATSASDLQPAEKNAAYEETAADAQRALSLDPHIGLAYFALAVAHPGAANWSRRVALLEQGLRAEPTAAELDNLMGEALLSVGRSSEAIVYFQRSVDLDPLSPVKTAGLIEALTDAGRYDQAQETIVKAFQIWPHDQRIWSRAFLAEARLGDPDKAERLIDNPDRPDMRDPADADYWRARLQYSRHSDAARRNVVINLLEKRARALNEGAELAQASDLATLDRVDLAYEIALPAANRLSGDGADVLFRSDLATFRADPRFMTLAKRLGLVKIWRASGHWPDFCGSDHAPYDCAAAATRAPD